jgi:hypothetical protein
MFMPLLRPIEVAVPSPWYVMIPLSTADWRDKEVPVGTAKLGSRNGTGEIVHVLAVVNAYAPRRYALRCASATATDAIPVVIRAKPDTTANCLTLTKFLMTHLLSAG